LAERRAPSRLAVGPRLRRLTALTEHGVPRPFATRGSTVRCARAAISNRSISTSFGPLLTFWKVEAFYSTLKVRMLPPCRTLRRDGHHRRNWRCQTEDVREIRSRAAVRTGGAPGRRARDGLVGRESLWTDASYWLRHWRRSHCELPLTRFHQRHLRQLRSEMEK
jgi:hypothetical protein